MNCNPSPLRFKSYFVTDLMFTANPKHEPKKPAELHINDLQVECNAERSKEAEGGQSWRVALRVMQNVGPDRNAPYNFMISVLGDFEVHPKYPSEKAEQLVRINGCSVLYSTVREILKSAMARGPFPPLFLPTVHFLGMEAPKASVAGRKKAKS